MSETTLRYIRDAVRSVLPVDEQEITVDRHFKELGADSIDRLEIIAWLRRELGIREPTSAFAGINEIGAMAEFCERHASLGGILGDAVAPPCLPVD